MCGRFSIATPWEELKERFRIEIPEGKYRPRYNGAPGQDMLVVPQNAPREGRFYRWGLVPRWAKDPKIGYRLINARAETIDEKPVFRTPFKKNRCLVLADGFYEWDKSRAKHVPYRINFRNHEPFAFAGICDHWEGEDGKILDSFSIITTKSNRLISKIHDRMPVILSPEEEADWLNGELDIKRAKSFLDPYPEQDLEMYGITTLVNSPKNETPDVLRSA